MMNDIHLLLPFLISPDSGSKLEYDKDTQIFHDASINKTYLTLDSIPVLLPSQEKEGLQIPEIIAKYNSQFSYIDHYQKDAEIFNYSDTGLNGSNRHENKRLHQTILRQIPEKAGFILDVGCGGGWLAGHIKNTGHKLCSIDISTVNPKNIIKNYPFPGHGALVADVYHLPFQENAFDCIIASEVMEHTLDPEEFIKNLVYVLKPGGKLIITTPYREKMEYTLCIHCNKPTPLNAHFHSFSEENIHPVLSQMKRIRFQTRSFSNKMLISLRFYIILQFFGYMVWKATDSLMNRISKKQTRFLIVIEKEK